MSTDIRVINFLSVKLASRCNLDCTYCYWFRDQSVYAQPPVLTVEAERALFEKLEVHISKYNLETFSILFHGGEPLLFKKKRFISFLNNLLLIQGYTNCEFKLNLTTNGVLIDPEWVEIFRTFNVGVTVSIDGPPEVHDKFRVDMKGHGSHKQVIHGLDCLREAGVKAGVLAVCVPGTDPEQITKYFVDELGIKMFDILVPDATHADNPASIASYYKKLFDLWYDEYATRGIEVRFPKALLNGILGGKAKTDDIGYGPFGYTIAMITDGALEVSDILRITGTGANRTEFNIQTHNLQDVTTDPRWQEVYHASLNLCETCETCEYRNACGGGHMAHRWSPTRHYNNPSVYCADLKEIFDHIWDRIEPELYQIIPIFNSVSCD